MNSADLSAMTYEQLMIYAMDKGLGVPEEGELRGQSKAELRQSLLDWLEKRLQKPPPGRPSTI